MTNLLTPAQVIPASPAPVNRITFTLPGLGISKNKLYAPEPRTIHSDRLTWGPTTEAKQWRSRVQRYVKVLTIASDSYIRVDLWFFLNRYLKDGKTWRRVDIANYIDWTLDTIAQKQDWNDDRCACGSWNFSHDTENPRIAVMLTEVRP